MQSFVLCQSPLAMSEVRRRFIFCYEVKMDNIDLLEMAAKSIGIETHGAMRADWLNGHSTYWNPLTDDGDALRLAVKLQLVIRPQERCVYVESNPESLLGQASVSELEMNGNDANAAARRAIVRAAASIGEQMK